MSTASTLRLAALSLLWGSSFLWIAIALRGMSPAQTVIIRLALGALVLYPITRLQHLTLPRGTLIWAHLTAAALFANAIPYTLFAVAQQHIASSAAGVINATAPLWTILIGYAAGIDRHISALKFAGFIIGFLGTLVIFAPWHSASEIATWGGLAALIASVSYGVSYVYMNRYLVGRGITPLVLSTSQLIAATALMLTAAPFIDGFQPLHPRWDALAAIAILGAFGTGAAYILNYRLIADEGITASVVTYLLPVIAVILGALVLSEPLTMPIILGMAIILIGVALTRRATPTDK
jgi:drug/metabolite transporter (DMT)-like permease